MTTSTIVLLAGLSGLLVGLLVALLPGAAATRSARRSAAGAAGVRGAPGDTAPVLPSGAADVLAALRSSAIVIDAADRVVRASPAAYALGIVRGDALVVDALRDLAAKVRRDGRVREIDLEVPSGGIGRTSVEVGARVALLPADPAELVLVLVDDRTESRRLDAVRRDFVANVSHELKTPVGALRLLSEAVAGASSDPEAVRRFAGRMQHEAERLTNLVQDLIDLSRLQDHDALRQPHVVELDNVVREALDRCRLQADAGGIGMVTAGEAGVSVLGDEAMLVTAVRNLVDNAVAYSPPHTRVVVSVRRAGGVGGVGGVGGIVELSVTDQGIGIPEGDLERIFERFYRVDPARSRATGGTGLGLAIVKHVVGNHGGSLSVWSVEGAGSTFTLCLPVGALPAPEDPDGQPTHTHTAQPVPFRLREATP